MNNLKTVINEVAALEPVLLADDAPGALTGNSNPSAIRTKVKIVNGRGYVFAYNTKNVAASATFTWNTAPGGVTVNAENARCCPRRATRSPIPSVRTRLTSTCSATAERADRGAVRRPPTRVRRMVPSRPRSPSSIPPTARPSAIRRR
jgi:hypothetical protein